MSLNGSVRTNDYDGRYYTVNWTATQSVGSNSSTIHWTLSCAGGNAYGGAGWYAERALRVTIAGNVVVHKTDFVKRYAGNIASGSVVVGHAPDGAASFNISLETAVYVSSVNLRGSADFTLDAIARASQPSCVTWPNHTENIGNMGDTIPIHMNRSSTSFTHTVHYIFGNTSAVIGEHVADEVSWTIPLTLANQVPRATSGIGTIRVDTYNGSTKIGTKTCMFTCQVPESIRPTVTGANVTIDNSANSVVAGWGLCVMGFSKAIITASASGAYGSGISSFSITGACQATQAANSLSYHMGAFSSSGKKVFTVRATDSRGRTSDSRDTGEINVVPYFDPYVSAFTASRSSSDNSQIVVYADWSHASVNGKNNAAATLSYKKATDNGWITYGSIAKATNVTLTGTFSEEFSYDFKVTVTDTTGHFSSRESTVPTAEVLLDFRAGGKGLGVGKIAETDSLEVAMDAKFMKSLEVDMDAKFMKNLVMTGAGTGGSNLNLRNIESLVKGWILSYAHPVGSIYINVSGANPGSFLGGTWVSWGTGRVPVGVNTNDANFNTVEKTGGQSAVTLTAEQIPPHAHPLWALQWNQEKGNTSLVPGTDVYGGDETTTKIACGLPDGGTGAHDNLQPYITCYMWKRTA